MWLELQERRCTVALMWTHCSLHYVSVKSIGRNNQFSMFDYNVKSSNYPLLFWPLVTSNVLPFTQQRKIRQTRNKDFQNNGASENSNTRAAKKKIEKKSNFPPAHSFGSEDKFCCFCRVHNSFKIFCNGKERKKSISVNTKWAFVPLRLHCGTNMIRLPCSWNKLTALPSHCFSQPSLSSLLFLDTHLAKCIPCFTTGVKLMSDVIWDPYIRCCIEYYSRVLLSKTNKKNY